MIPRKRAINGGKNTASQRSTALFGVVALVIVRAAHWVAGSARGGVIGGAMGRSAKMEDRRGTGWKSGREWPSAPGAGDWNGVNMYPKLATAQKLQGWKPPGRTRILHGRLAYWKLLCSDGQMYTSYPPCVIATSGCPLAGQLPFP